MLLDRSRIQKVGGWAVEHILFLINPIHSSIRVLQSLHPLFPYDYKEIEKALLFVNNATIE